MGWIRDLPSDLGAEFWALGTFPIFLLWPLKVCREGLDFRRKFGNFSGGETFKYMGGEGRSTAKEKLLQGASPGYD